LKKSTASSRRQALDVGQPDGCDRVVAEGLAPPADDLGDSDRRPLRRSATFAVPAQGLHTRAIATIDNPEPDE